MDPTTPGFSTSGDAEAKTTASEARRYLSKLGDRAARNHRVWEDTGRGGASQSPADREPEEPAEASLS